MSKAKEKLFSFGIIADVQHANADNKLNYQKTNLRYYRAALQHLRQAVKTWNEIKVDFGMQLGDIIDGVSKRLKCSDEDIKNLCDAMEEFTCTGLPVINRGHTYYMMNDESERTNQKPVPYICHVWGNHEFYNFSRSWLWCSKLNSFIEGSNQHMMACNEKEKEKRGGYYFSFRFRGYRFVILDAYDISIIARPADTTIYDDAMTLLTSKNTNSDLNEPSAHAPHMVQWNGALSDRQLSWLRNELINATDRHENVLIFSHIAVHPRASYKSALCWNYEEVLAIINSFSCVKAFFAGHDHDGGFYHDPVHNTYHITMEGVVERAPDTNAFAVAHVYENYIDLVGYGDTKSRTLKF